MNSICYFSNDFLVIVGYNQINWLQYNITSILILLNRTNNFKSPHVESEETHQHQAISDKIIQILQEQFSEYIYVDDLFKNPVILTHARIRANFADCTNTAENVTSRQQLYMQAESQILYG
ncbi:Hypothetical_protein [Hexamita inflata]|uniref:Hypothetical_protein n=1 Tax=Hexamita inflata TaxID=28002 RepID=A0AA86R5M6_9EUKA|nr:Hypothetical protein HINF_LOCUS54263 [Hexamita inflata]